MAHYEEYIEDTFTGEVALIKSNDYYIFKQKKQAKFDSWEKRGERLKKQQTKEEGLERAIYLTEEASKEYTTLNQILKYTLDIDDRIEWDSLKDFKKYKKFEFTVNPPQENEFYKNVPLKSFWEKIFKSKLEKREKLENEAQNNYNAAVKNFEKQKARAKSEYEDSKAEFEKLQNDHNTKIDLLINDFENGQPEAIEAYLELVFSNSTYPDCIQLNYDIVYSSDRRTVIIDADLPDPDNIPKVTEYKYIASRNDFTTKELKKKEFEDLYNEIIAQISIRTIHEVFESVYPDVLDFVVFNGYVNAIDKKTGNEIRNCILSIQAEKEYFLSLKLDNVSAIDCIKGLKGVIASEFINLAPVKPILHLNREDKRIIESEEIIDSIDPSNNLADMEWQKFETLVRDLFAKEFSGDGVDVKVTQASRDAGVDAIVFDPDPIKGGKFVIQAKRYNNVVGVGAVRDLYGTVMNEGAVKGILVTTANYGKDSIEFVKNKPLTLISGAELVHMFNRHGYDVKIATRKKIKVENRNAQT